jgi:uncharacterized Rmd1/YagE family protein
MRRCMNKIAVPARRNLHSGLPTPRPARCSHQSTFVPQPRTQNFSASSFLRSNGDRSSQTTPSHAAEDAAQEPTSNAPPKRRAARSSVSKKNLRETSLTKKSKRSHDEAKKSATLATTDESDSDYMHKIQAVCVAQSFDMEVVEEILRFQGFDIDPDGTDLDLRAVIHARSVNKGDIFVFKTGTVVSWSVPTDTIMKIATKQLIRAANFPHADHLEIEDLDFSTDDTRETSYIRNQQEVVLGTRDENGEGRKLDTTMAKIAFSMGLARSTKLAVLEEKLDEFHEKSKPVAITLAGGSELSQSREFVLKKTGEILGLRSQLNHYYELTDSLPDIFWDTESKIEEYYTRVGNILDINQRIKQLNSKIDYANELVGVMREISSEKRGHRLELIIIILIAIEVVFGIRNEYREYLHGKSRDEAAAEA